MSRNASRLASAVLGCLVAVIPQAVRAEPVIQIVETSINSSRASAGDGVIVKLKIANVGTTTAVDVRAAINGSDHFDFFPPDCSPLDYRSCHFGDIAPGQIRWVKFAAEVTGYVKGEIRDAWLVVDVHAGEEWVARASFPVAMVGNHN